MMTIYQKLLAAREAMGHFEKSGVHQQNWKYFEGDKVLEQVGDALAAQGILFMPCQTDAEVTTTEETGKNDQVKTVEHAFVRFEMTFIDTETGETAVIPSHGSARDYGDKALFKAQTLAIKYLFLRMFLKGEGDGEDPDAESVPPARQRTNGQARRSSKSRQPASAPDFEGNARAKSEPPAAGENTMHWSTVGTEQRKNFDRAMAYNGFDEMTIKVALGSEDPKVSIDTLLLDYDSVGAAIKAVTTYAKEHAANS